MRLCMPRAWRGVCGALGPSGRNQADGQLVPGLGPLLPYACVHGLLVCADACMCVCMPVVYTGMHVLCIHEMCVRVRNVC